MAKLSVIIPCYFNELNIPVTTKKLLENESLFVKETEFEYIMVDDGSKDSTYLRLLEFYNQYPQKVKLIKLASNVGSYNAIIAGMEYATGDCCAVISADLQDPPEIMPQMYSYWLKGVKLVIANRVKRNDKRIAAFFSNFFNFLTRRFALKNLPKGGFDFVLFDKSLQSEVVKIKEKNTNSLYLLLWLGYDYVTIPYERKARELGVSRWTFKRKMKLFIDSFVAFSFSPIRLISTLGLILGVLSILYAVVILFLKVSGRITLPGWTTLMMVFLFVSSFQMIALGILGEYLWRTLDAVRNRPLYTIEEVRGN